MAEREWRACLEEAGGALLQCKLGDLASAESLSSAIIKAFERDKTIEALARKVQLEWVAWLRADKTLLGEYLPKSAQKIIDALLERPDLIPENVVRNFFEQDALDSVMRDLLYDTIKSFNDSVNPFFAEWGLPSLIKRFIPIGSGALLKSMEAVRGEFDKRLEPEIRKFLQVFSRKALRKLGDITLSSSSDSKAIGVRKAIVAWLCTQETRSFVANLDKGSLGLFQDLEIEIAAHVTQMKATRKLVNDVLDSFFTIHADRTLADIFSHYGVSPAPDYQALADHTWPFVKAVVVSPPFRARLGSFVSDFYDSIET